VKSVSSIWKQLKNPFVLVGQGFVAGALLFWAVQSHASPRLPPQATANSVGFAAQ
jgi:hypothetical protein